MAQVLQQAASVSATTEGSLELLDYVVSLREGIMDAWGGIVLAIRSVGKRKGATSPWVGGVPSC